MQRSDTQADQIGVTEPRASGRRPHRIGAQSSLTAARQHRALDRRLSAALAEGEAPCQILSGMGGAGKSQIAAAFARDQWRSGALDLLVWVDAASRIRMESG